MYDAPEVLFSRSYLNRFCSKKDEMKAEGCLLARVEKIASKGVAWTRGKSGLETLISAQVENPFNFADVDHDLDSFSKRLHDETLVVAREVAPPGTRCRDYWITERKGFAARNGSKRKKKKRTGEGYFKQVSEKLVTYHDEL